MTTGTLSLDLLLAVVVWLGLCAGLIAGCDWWARHRRERVLAQVRTHAHTYFQRAVDDPYRPEMARRVERAGLEALTTAALPKPIYPFEAERQRLIQQRRQKAVH